MKLRFLAIAFAAMFVVAAAQAQVYFQNPDFNGAFSSQNDTTGGFGLFAQVYDNFTLGSDANLNQAQWVGSYFNPPQQGPITAWTLQIYDDAGGQPGSLLYQQQVGGTAQETFLGLDNVGDPTYLYTLDISFAATAGTEYWLSVYPDLGFPPQWGWETATGGDGASWQCFFGSCGPLANDVAFALFANQTTTPEPGTLIMFGTGIIGLAGAIRRKLF